MTALRFTPSDINSVIRNCAQEMILPFYQNLHNSEISTKSDPADFVTHADEQSEDYLRAQLARITPEAHFIGEEGIAKGRDTYQHLFNKNTGIWVADPIDGTYNFVHGRPVFAVMLAYVEDGQTLYGAIYDPVRDLMTYAVRGQGAFCEDTLIDLDNTKQTPLREARGYVAIQLMPATLKARYSYLAAQTGDVQSLGCCGQEYLSIAHGHRHFGIYHKIKPWDHLAGALIVQEAGGEVAKWDGTAFTPADIDQSLLIASDPDLWDEIHEKWLQDLGY